MESNYRYLKGLINTRNLFFRGQTKIPFPSFGFVCASNLKLRKPHFDPCNKRKYHVREDTKSKDGKERKKKKIKISAEGYQFRWHQSGRGNLSDVTKEQNEIKEGGKNVLEWRRPLTQLKKRDKNWRMRLNKERKPVE